jgi:hypothetical protein
MVSRNHNNRSEKQKGHTPVGQDTGAQEHNPAAQGHQGGSGAQMSRDGVDRANDGKSPQNGGGDGAGGAPRQQGQGQANKHVDNHHENRGHG